MIKNRVITKDRKMKKILKNLKIQGNKRIKILKLIFILIIPLVLTSYLFPLFKEIKFQCEVEKECYIREDNKPSFKNLFADALQVPLNLKWYKVYIDYFPVEKEMKKYCGDDFQLDYFKIELSEDFPQKYQRSNLIKDQKNSNFYQIPQGKKGYFLASNSDNIYLRAMFLYFDCDCDRKDECNLDKPYNLYIKSYIWSWVAKLILIYLLWLYLFAAILTIKNWLNNK